MFLFWLNNLGMGASPALAGLEYNIYSNAGSGPINYGSIVATTSDLTWTSGTLSYPATWMFGVRAYNPSLGLEEKNLDCALYVILDSSGHDITNRPNPPTALRAFALAAGGVRVEWIYPVTRGAKTPTGFHVYIGTPTPSYGSPAATVAYSTGIMNSFVANLAGLTGGTTYQVVVRAYNATAEEPNTNVVSVTADATGPTSVDSLTGAATAQA